MASKDNCWKADLPAISATLVSLAKQAGDMITSAKPISADTGTKKVGWHHISTCNTVLCRSLLTRAQELR